MRTRWKFYDEVNQQRVSPSRTQVVSPCPQKFEEVEGTVR